MVFFLIAEDFFLHIHVIRLNSCTRFAGVVVEGASTYTTLRCFVSTVALAGCAMMGQDAALERWWSGSP